MTTDGQQFDVAWYFTDLSTPLFPSRTRFSSLNWTRPAWANTVPGEVVGAPRPWRDGSLPPGVPFSPYPITGAIEWHRDGAPPGAVPPAVFGGVACDFVLVPTPCWPNPLPTTLHCRAFPISGCPEWSGWEFDLIYLGGGLWGADAVPNPNTSFPDMFCRLKCDTPAWRMNLTAVVPDPTFSLTGFACTMSITDTPLTMLGICNLVPQGYPTVPDPTCSVHGVVQMVVSFPL